MTSSDTIRLADALAIASIRLIRRLRGLDPAPRLSGPQASALAVIVHSGRIRPSDLAAIEEVKRPTIARVVAELEAEGLVERTAAPEDGRGRWIAPTAKGAALLQEGQRRRIEPLATELATLSHADLETLRRAATLIERLGERAVSRRGAG